MLFAQLKASSGESETSLREQLTRVQEQAQQQIVQLSAQVLIHLLLLKHLLHIQWKPPNNRHIGDERFVHCSEVEMYGQIYIIGTGQIVCPL